MIEILLERITGLSIIAVPIFVNSLLRGITITIAAAFVIPALRLKAASRHRAWLGVLILICALPFSDLSIRTESLNSAPLQHFQASHPIFNIPLYSAVVLLCSVICFSVLRMIALAGSIFSLLSLRKSSKEASSELQRLLLECVSQKKLKRSVKVRITSSFISPCLIGFIRPVILIPENLLANLEPQEIRQILSHELAHLKRFDDWTILFQKILASLFSFQPAVLWIGKQMSLERELACDDSVIDSGEIPRSYALCLTRLAELASTYAPAAILSAGSQLNRRIEMLLNKNETRCSPWLRAEQISAMFLVLGCGLLISQEGSLLAVSPDKENLVMLDPNNTFENAQQRFEDARIKLEEAREEMLAAGEEMRNAQQELKEQKTGIRRSMKLSIPEPPSLPVLAPPPAPEAPPAVMTAPEAPPTIAAPSVLESPAVSPLPESPPAPTMKAVPELTPVPHAPPSTKVHDDRIK